MTSWLVIFIAFLFIFFVVAMLLMDHIGFSYFCRGPPSDHSYPIIFPFHGRIQRGGGTWGPDPPEKSQ